MTPANPQAIPAPHQRKSTRAFTLIELSIVLVIIGLIVGGVLVGRSLVKMAELNSVVSEARKLYAAVYTFKTKFNCLPGDCTNATALWPNDSQYAGFRTWNGDGDGSITFLGLLQPYEYLRVAQQLSLSGLIQGAYVSADSVVVIAAGVHIPQTPIAGTGYMIHTRNDKLMVLAGKLVSADTRRHDDAMLSPSDTRMIDAKFDDGLPLSGVFQGYNPHGTSTGCVLGTDPLTAIYDVIQSGTTCRIVFSDSF